MKITVHPLFIAVGIASALFGGLPVFIIYALTALLHECGHIFCASKMGLECSKISLMPYGAAAMCNLEGISAIDEIKLSLSGPAVNTLICIACAGLWWFYPETYSYTDVIFQASKVMLLINVLPAYPLDGGRIAQCVLITFLSPKIASIVLRIISLLLSIAFILLFFLWQKNLSLLIFAAFLFFSAFEKSANFSKMTFAFQKPKRGREIKEVLLSNSSTYKDAIRYLDGSKYIIFKFYSQSYLDEICQDELLTLMETHNIYDKILDR